jgi:hypothetical protein
MRQAVLHVNGIMTAKCVMLCRGEPNFVESALILVDSPVTRALAGIKV